MNGSLIKLVIDTNIIFMSLYDSSSKAAKIIELAEKNKLQLFSTDSVKEELIRVLKRELNFNDKQIEVNINKLPITWVEKEVYQEFLDKTKVKHKPDKPVEALALVLNCGILSADNDFKDRLNVDELLDRLEDDK